MAAIARMPRQPTRRLEVRVPFTHSTDLAFGIALRSPRARARRSRRGAFRRWCRATSNALLVSVTILAPGLIALGATDLRTIVAAHLFRAAEADAIVLAVPSATRPALHARHPITTVTSPEPPLVRTYVVQPGDTLLSLAARFGLAPQTLAYDNDISDSAALRAGDSLLIPPFDAALHVMTEGDTIAAVAVRFGLDEDAVRSLNRIATDDSDAIGGRILVLPVPDAQYPGFKLRLSEPPRVLAPRVRWPTEGVITQLYSPGHQGVDIAAPYGAPIVAPDVGTVSWVGWRGDGGLAVCLYHDWGLETCAYHTSATYVEVGQRVAAGQRIAAIGSTGVSTGPHVHWEARTNGALVDPLTYATSSVAPRVGVTTRAP